MQLPAYYEFCNSVKTIVGHKALEQIPQSLKAINAQRPMIITDKGVEQAGLIKIVQAAMQKSKLKAAALFDNVPADSDVKVVNEVAKIYRAKKCDSIIAVG
ncbi:MAG: iron-containing alcohol dehydrogenase, partial [Spirochaetota bacterium]